MPPSGPTPGYGPRAEPAAVTTEGKPGAEERHGQGACRASFVMSIEHMFDLHVPIGSSIPKSSRTAQCSTTKPSATRNTCTCGHATRTPETGRPANRGKPLPMCVPYIVYHIMMRSRSSITACRSTTRSAKLCSSHTPTTSKITRPRCWLTLSKKSR